MSIIGILDCKNKTIYGINKNSNVPLVLFKPHDKSIGNLLVPSKLKYTNKNHYCVVRIHKHNPNSKYRFPIANIKYVIGQVGDEKAHCEYILHSHNLNIKEPKLQISKTKLKKLKHIDNIWKLINKSHLSDYKDLRNIHTISVDPLGSQDIDDAISFVNNKIGIHIADVSFWLKHFNTEPHFFSTIYTPHRKINMIPRFLADNICSLIAKKDRLALTFWYNLETNSYNFENTIINVKKNYTYENFPISKYQKMYRTSEKIGKMYQMDNKWNTHKMIEAFMVLANNKTAEYLRDHNLHLFRTHTEKFHNIPIHTIKNEKFKEFMNIYLSNSASYSESPGSHYGLNLDFYTHFTSPIRRMADVYVHRMIKKEETITNLEKCNNDMKQTKRLKRDFEKFKVISELKNTITTNGFVINFNENNLLVYFPEMDFCDRIPIISHNINNKEQRNSIIQEKMTKLKELGELSITISKKNDKLVYHF